MTFVIPDRKAVAQLKYQLRRFENQCAELPAETRLRIQQEMKGLRSLLAECEPERCTDGGGHCHYERAPFSRKNLCTVCHAPAPADALEYDPKYVGHGCRGLGLYHRWQKSEFSDRRYCTKCGEPDEEYGDH